MHSEPRTDFFAQYGDGLSASRSKVAVGLDEKGLTFVKPDGSETTWSYTDVQIGDPLRKSSIEGVVMARGVGNASLYIDDALLLARLAGQAPQIWRRSERRRALMPGLGVGTLALAGFAVVWAFDLSPTKGLASAMPPKARSVLGESVLRTLPEQRRCSSPEGRAALTKLVGRLMPKGPITAENIVVLDWAVLNAFTVPGNRIVLTRTIIEQAKSADELAAVIGHEAGHAVELHPEAGLVRSVGFWALIQMVFTGTPGAVGNIGAVLAQLGYTRSAEREADAHALRLLKDAHISPKGMADLFRRMEAQAGTKPKDNNPPTNGGGASDLFASHPSNPERIALIDSQQPYPSTPAMSDSDWASLQSICRLRDGGATPVTPLQNRPKTSQPAVKSQQPTTSGETKQASVTPPAPRQRETEAGSAATAKAEADKSEASKAETAEKAAAANAASDEDAAAKAAARVAGEKAAADKAAQEAKARVAAAEPPANPSPPTSNVPTPPPSSKSATNTDAPVVAPAAPADTKIDAANRKIAADPANAVAYFERGQAHGARADHLAAIDDFTQSLKLRPANVDTLFARAIAYNQRKMFNEGIADYTEVIRLAPQNFGAYNNRANMLRAQQKTDAALSDYSMAVAINGKNAVALTNRAMIYRERKDIPKAMADLTAAIAVNPSYGTALIQRAEIFQMKNQRELAIADYQAVLRIAEAPGGRVADLHKTARARLATLGVAQ